MVVSGVTVPTMDGIAVMAYPIGPGPVQPSLEGVQEVNVQLANTPAEFATPANFAVVTKSGGNDYHGSAFWDFNSSKLNARDFFSPSAPFRVYHNFGGSIGGPIHILQPPGYVVFLYETHHEWRIVPLDGPCEPAALFGGSSSRRAGVVLSGNQILTSGG